jgi:CBS domain-containing protein
MHSDGSLFPGSAQSTEADASTDAADQVTASRSARWVWIAGGCRTPWSQPSVALLGRSSLRAKGTRVATIRPDATVADLVRGLRDEGIGAMVVSDDGYHLDGIVSERDVVRALAQVGGRVLQQRVSEIMSTEVMTCSTTDPVKAVMELMTRHRIRHLPVMANGRLAGIISIGDVVKNRLDEMATETSVLRETYLGGR